MSDPLTPPQQRVVDDVLCSDGPAIHVLQGSGGTGKSTLMRQAVTELEAQGARVLVLASTGIAALNVGGCTVDSAFGLKPGRFIPGGFPPRTSEAVASADVIIVDEFPMLRCDKVDQMDSVARTSRRSRKPFGGCKMLLVGDVLQLPPVLPHDDRDLLLRHYPSAWWFDSKLFRSLNEGSVRHYRFHALTEVLRQNDPDFIHVLRCIRNERDLEQACAVLNTRVTGASPDDALTLTCYRSSADAINSARLALVDGDERSYRATAKNFDLSDAQAPSPHNLVLRVGAHVVFTKNCDVAANGQQGTVVNLRRDHVEVRLSSSERVVEVQPETWTRYEHTSRNGSLESVEAGSFQQLPLRLGYALTIHRSQSCTLDRAHVDFGRRTFSAGQGYVAISRVRSLAGLSFQRPVTPHDLRCDPIARAWLRQQWHVEKMRLDNQASPAAAVGGRR